MDLFGEQKTPYMRDTRMYDQPAKKGDIIEESTTSNGVRRRTLIGSPNASRRSGYDVSRERLNVCAFCGREEWVKELSRNTKWERSLVKCRRNNQR